MKTAVVLLCLAVAIAYASARLVNSFYITIHVLKSKQSSIIKDILPLFTITFNFSEINASKVDAKPANTISALKVPPNTIVPVNVDFAPFAHTTLLYLNAKLIVKIILMNVFQNVTMVNNCVWLAVTNVDFK